MRYLVGFICVLALGGVPLVGCGERAVSCGEDKECDDGNVCTFDDCAGEIFTPHYCEHKPIDCRERLPLPYDSECATAEFEVCDTEAPEFRACGEVTFINEDRGCGEDSGMGCFGGSWVCSSGRCRCLGCWPFC